MEAAFAVLTGAMVAASIYLMLGRHLVRFVFGLAVAANAVNLLIFTAGRLGSPRPPLISDGTTGPMANALPQALILTAIVIGFALLAFVFVLFYRVYQALQTADTRRMRVAEPEPDKDGAPAGKGIRS
jgi:multicomponent Na+:H+ antiporter subunit C